MLSDSVLDTLRTAAAARDRYRREVLGVTIDEPTATLGIESQIVDFALTATDWYTEKADAMQSNEARLLGQRINKALDTARRSVRDIGELLLTIPHCDDELPPGSRLTWSHLNDALRASSMIAEAQELIEQLTPEALENEEA